MRGSHKRKAILKCYMHTYTHTYLTYIHTHICMQVEGHSDIFAVGDCNNYPETKMGVTAASNRGKELFMPKGQSDYILENIVALSKVICVCM